MNNPPDLDDGADNWTKGVIRFGFILTLVGLILLVPGFFLLIYILA